MSLYLPIAFLSMQLIVLGFFGPTVTGPAAYILMVIAPLFAALATLRRGRSHTTSVRFGWYALSLALTIWAAGAFGNLWQEMVLHRQNEMYRASMLAFNLAVVPTTYLLASDWRLHGRQLLRAARYGGEEFIVLLRDGSAAGAQAAAERLRATVQSLRIENSGSPEAVVTVSIGFASAELTDEAAAARMVEDADRALYEAKCAGRNQVKLATGHNAEFAAAASITARRRRLLG
jgi:hypothetical protein